MNPMAVSGVQFTLSLIVFSLAAIWWVAPALNKLPLQSALVPLFFVHALRYLPSTAFAPGQVGADVPADAMATIAYGDLLAAVLAIVAIVFLHYRWRGALGVAWGVNILASLDWLNASFLAASNKLVTHALGGNWYIIHYYVPALLITHIMIFARLMKGEQPMVTANRGSFDAARRTP